jgi:peptidoglycan L-alanyl-D-glutamate endopeptidase CwlK
MNDILPDKITLERIKLLYPCPEIQQDATDIYYEILTEAQIKVRFTRTYSSWAEQNAIYQQGRTTPGKIVTNAKAGQSFHNYRLAVDFCLLHSNGSVSWNPKEDIDDDNVEDWKEVVNIFKEHGWVWGGDFKGKFKDTPHFQKTFGLTLTQLIEYTKNGSIYDYDIPGIYVFQNK